MTAAVKNALMYAKHVQHLLVHACTVTSTCLLQGMPLILKNLNETEFVVNNLPAGSTHLIAGVIAGMTGATLSHPFDTVKVCLRSCLLPPTEATLLFTLPCAMNRAGTQGEICKIWYPQGSFY